MCHFYWIQWDTLPWWVKMGILVQVINILLGSAFLSVVITRVVRSDDSPAKAIAQVLTTVFKPLVQLMHDQFDDLRQQQNAWNREHQERLIVLEAHRHCVTQSEHMRDGKIKDDPGVWLYCRNLLVQMTAANRSAADAAPIINGKNMRHS